MEKEEILRLENRPITLRQLISIEESEGAKGVYTIAESALYPYMCDMRVVFTDGQVINVYL